MTRNEQRSEFMRKIGMLCIIAKDKGINLMPFYFHRTRQEQILLYAKGRRGIDGEKIVTQQDGIKNVSAHQNWLAMDLVIVSDDGYNLKWSSEKYKIVGEIWEDMGIGHIWGGRWTEPRDPYHFEMRGE